MVKKPAKIQIGSLRYLRKGDSSGAAARASRSAVLKYANRAKPAPNMRALQATTGPNPPTSIPMSNPQTVARFTNVNPPESHFMELDWELDSRPALAVLR